MNGFDDPDYCIEMGPWCPRCGACLRGCADGDTAFACWKCGARWPLDVAEQEAD